MILNPIHETIRTYTKKLINPARNPQTNPLKNRQQKETLKNRENSI